MTNRYRGEVPFPIDGKVMTLAYRWGEIARLRDEIGADFDVQINRAAMDLDLRLIARVLAIGLGGTMTEAAIVAASPPILDTVDAIRRALNLAFRGEEEAPADAVARPPLLSRAMSWLRPGRQPIASA